MGLDRSGQRRRHLPVVVGFGDPLDLGGESRDCRNDTRVVPAVQQDLAPHRIEVVAFAFALDEDPPEDLDGDGNESTFRLEAGSNPDNSLYRAPGINSVDPLE